MAGEVLRLSHGHGYPECDGVRDFELDQREWRAHFQGDHGDGSGRDPERVIQRDGDDRQGDLPTPGAQHRRGAKTGTPSTPGGPGENHADPQRVYESESG